MARNGVLYKVTGVSTDGGVTTVNVRQARLEEAVKNADFKSETEMSFDKNGNLLKTAQRITQSTPGGAETVVFKQDGGVIDIQSDYTQSLKVKAKLHYTDLVEISKVKDDDGGGGGGGRVETECKITEAAIDLDVDYTLTYVFDIKIEDYALKYTKMSVRPGGHIYLGGSIAGQISGKLNQDSTKFIALPLGSLNFNVWIVPVVISNIELSLHWLLAGEAEIEVSMACSTKYTGGEYGFKYENGKMSRISDIAADKNSTFNHNVSGNIRTGISLHLTANLYDYDGAKFDLSAAPNVKLSVGAQLRGLYAYDEGFKNSDANKVSVDLCLDIGAEMKLEALGYGVKLSADTSLEVWNIAKGNAMPTFDDLDITQDLNKVRIKSGITKGALGVHVGEYGLWIGADADGYRNGTGKTVVLGTEARPGVKVDIDTSVSKDMGEGKFYVRPYFKNGAGGVYYDKAKTFYVLRNNYCTNVNTCKQDKIGVYTWMTENLNIQTEDSWCYGGSADSCAKYGRLYTWEAAKKACPTGWRLPARAEWQTAVDYAGGAGSAGSALKAESGWNGNNGTNASGFWALPGGYRTAAGVFRETGESGYWWTSAEDGGYAASIDISYLHNRVTVGTHGKGLGYSVRCLTGDPVVIDTAAVCSTWSDWTVTTPATCETEGEETRTCAQTGATETRAIEKLTEAMCGTGGGVRLGFDDEVPAGAIKISSFADLCKIGKEMDMDGVYELIGNIDASESRNMNDGNGFEPIGKYRTQFTGRFYGKGYTISGLYINRPDDDYVGLFGYINGSYAVVSGVHLVDVSITGRDYVGGLVGSIYNGSIYKSGVTGGTVTAGKGGGGLAGWTYGTVEDCYSTAKVSGGSNDYVGGLVGWIGSDGSVSRSYSSGAVDGYSYAGGLAGLLFGTITDCYSVSAVTGNYTGGLVGNVNTISANPTIKNSYSAGSVSGVFRRGGLLGNWYRDSTYKGTLTITSSYWDAQTAGIDTSAGTGAAGKTTAQMTQQSTYGHL